MNRIKEYSGSNQNAESFKSYSSEKNLPAFTVFFAYFSCYTTVYSNS